MNTNFNKNKMTQEHFESKQAEVSDTELIETIETKLSKLCQTGGRSLSMSVPPQVSDIDMSICELIRRYKQLLITDVVVPKGTLKTFEDLPNETKDYRKSNDAIVWKNK